MGSSNRSQSTEKDSTESRQPSFRGSFSHTVDAKGRISLPSEFRRVLSEAGEMSVVITNYISEGSRCLRGAGESSWRAFEEKLRQKTRFDPKLLKLENYLLSRATECPVDGSGRIMIPQNLRIYAGLERDVTFTSSIHGFQMWDSRVWEHVFAQSEEEFMDDPALFAGLDV